MISRYDLVKWYVSRFISVNTLRGGWDYGKTDLGGGLVYTCLRIVSPVARVCLAHMFWATCCTFQVGSSALIIRRCPCGIYHVLTGFVQIDVAAIDAIDLVIYHVEAILVGCY